MGACRLVVGLSLIWLICISNLFANPDEELTAYEDSTKYLHVRLHHLTTKGDTVSAAVAKIETSANTAGASKLGFKGIHLVLDKDTLKSKFAVKWKDISLMNAIDIVRGFTLSNAETLDGFIIISNQPKYQTAVMKFDKAVVQAFSLHDRPTSTDLLKAVSDMGIKVDNTTRISISDDRKLAVVTLEEKEAILLESILELVGRGLKIQRE